jgi:hypothetical protein
LEQPQSWACSISPDLVVLADFNALQHMVENHAGQAFVWPDEGSFVDGIWRFNDAHAGQYEPLWIDPTTASLMVKVHAALIRPENKVKFERWVSKGRGQFGYMVEFCWKRAKAPGTHAGTA